MSRSLDFFLTVLAFWAFVWILLHLTPVMQWLDYVIRVPNA